MKQFRLRANESRQTTNTGLLFHAKNKLTFKGGRDGVLLMALLLTLFGSGCKKQTEETPDMLNQYKGLNSQTMTELKQARDAASRYQDVDNALADGYADISVDVEHMGHHYMKASLVDSVFDLKQPEILVYNKDENGEPVLVAIEYAVPLNKPRPEGFTGNSDVWDGNTGFQLWLLHAWVYAYNPSGVFTPTNPSVHLH